MHWLSIIIIGLASNLDNLGIGVSFGARSTRITPFSNLIIAVLSMLATYISITSGEYVSEYFSEANGNAIGGCLILFMGIWSIRAVYKKPTSTETAQSAMDGIESTPLVTSNSDSGYRQVLEWQESIWLGVALAINCIATGFGAGISGVNAAFTAISVGVFSFITVAVGLKIGNRFSKTWFGKHSELIGGLLLAGIGLYEIFI
ncbi:manganese efflux pump [Paenibacillus sp. G2S3]|uniref:manganese efflux pump n=1 Tax=Paenibacillus sp. G2S3 TaxID=3047872 RepID=UPI0024C16E4F|nr:manganese efflux pump [Paenibacillus sp. G2S3]WHY21711.1 manganese efflux pump [Paenibacillus sp. G2S3]